MNFPRKREAAPVEETAAAFYDYTRRLLQDTIRLRDMGKLRRCAIRIDSQRFQALSDSRQEELLELYSGAMVACGSLSP